MNTILKKLLEFADQLGVVSDLNCYNKQIISVDGMTRDGKSFSITLHFKEVSEDA